jgi:hypothetical protein
MTNKRRWTSLAALAAAVGLAGCTWVSKSTGPGTGEGSAGAAGVGDESESTGGAENRGSGGGPAEDGGGPAGGRSSRAETGGSSSAAAGTDAGSGGGTKGEEHTGGADTGGASNGGSGTGGLQQTGGIEHGGGTSGSEETGGNGGRQTGGTGGRQTGGNGGRQTGGTGGSNQSGGTGGGGTGDGGTGGGGTGGGGAGGTGGAGASGGSGGADATTVHGRVIDFWGHAVAGIPVDVDGTLTQTDQDGAFVVEDVSQKYDASLAILLSTRNYGWVYKGLTRRDPTLQVYRGLEERWGYFTVTPQNGSFATDRTLTLAFGGPDGSGMHDGVAENGVSTSTPWFGPEQTTETAHGLLWQYDEDTELPTSYVAYKSQLVALAEGSPAEFNLDLTSESIAAGNVQGTVVPVTSESRQNSVFVRFNTGAAIEVARDRDGPDSFTYLVPTLPNGSITVSASEGSGFSGAFSLAHADGLAASSTVSLTLPAPPSLTLPGPGTTGVTSSTPFQFAPGEGNGGAYLVVINSVDYYTALFIVTDEERFTLPTVAQGAYVLMSDEVFEWWVETHGQQTTVDEMAGPDGFLDAFSWETDRPAGPRQGEGEFTMSAARSFTTAE